MEKETAVMVRDLLRDCAGKLDSTVSLVKERCSEEELRTYRRSVGQVMGAIANILDPLYHQHPEIEPDALKQGRQAE